MEKLKEVNLSGNDNWSRSQNDENIPVVTPTSPEFVASKKPQVIAALISTIGSFSLGTVLAWSAPALPDLAKSQDLGDLTSTEKSWIASLAVLGALMSGLIAGFLINQLGRKRTMLLIAFPFVFGWLLIAFAQHLSMMYMGRFITGFAGGAFTVTVPVYVSETAEDKLRGFLGSAMVLMLVTGILFTFSAAAVVSWFWLTIISSTLPVIFFVSMLFMPETPRFLLLNGKTKDAYDALMWLRGATTTEEIEPELTKLRDSIENNNCEAESYKAGQLGASFRSRLTPSVMKPVGISLALMFFQQLGGINAVCFYTVDILKAANPHLDANVASIIIGIVQVIFVFLSMILVDKFGRKIFLVTSDVIMALSLAALGLFFFLKQETETNTQTSSMAFVPLVSLISFIIAYSAGAGPLPWLLMSEILPPNVKGIASGVVTSFYWLLAFVATKTFDDLIKCLDYHGTYWLYASICLAGAIFTIIFVPETKGKSSEEIQRYFGTPSSQSHLESRKQQNVNLLSEETMSFHDHQKLGNGSHYSP